MLLVIQKHVRAQILLRHCLTNLNLHKIYLGTSLWHEASVGCLNLISYKYKTCVMVTQIA